MIYHKQKKYKFFLYIFPPCYKNILWLRIIAYSNTKL